MEKMRIYLIGSLRNDHVPHIGIELRERGFDCFDDWHSNGKEADDRWQEYEQRRGRSFAEALAAPVAQNTFGLDKRMLNWCDAAVLVLPAGKSGHMELGYAIGRGKRGYILLDKEPERFDVMYAFANAVVSTLSELVEELNKPVVKTQPREPVTVTGPSGEKLTLHINPHYFAEGD
jgi:hypothetical protein